MHIQTLRGLACLLLVLFHVAGDSPDAGLRLPADHDLQFFNQVLIYLRMPLFGCIAGYVYARRPVGPEVAGFMAGKARRLLLPLLTVGSTFALVQGLMPGVNSEPTALWQMLLLPMAHFWFLQALFLVFLAIVALERLGLLRNAPRSLATAAFATGISLVAETPAWFSIDSAVYLLPYFLLGIAARQAGAMPKAVLAALGAAFIVIAVAVLTSSQPIWPRQSLVAYTIGALGTWLLVSLPWRQRTLALIGDHSYVIFLFHVFFTAASRMVLHKLGVDDTATLVVAGVLAGVIGPMVVGQAVERSAWASTLLLGAKLQRGGWRSAPAEAASRAP